MKVFISWAGDTSKAMAEVLHDVLPTALQAIKPFVSFKGIPSGARWSAALANELHRSDFGILCLTPEALTHPWLIFEAGALTKLPEGRACGLLHHVGVTEVTGPLAQFQHHVMKTKEAFEALLLDMNKASASPITDETVKAAARLSWPVLEERLAAIRPNESAVPKKRDPDELLEELVTRVRTIERHVGVAEQQRVSFEPTSSVVNRAREERLLSMTTDELELVKTCLNHRKISEQIDILENAPKDLTERLVAKHVINHRGPSLMLNLWVRQIATRLGLHPRMPVQDSP